MVVPELRKQDAMNTQAGLAQFAHGKLIDGGRDVRGYTIVARSEGLPPESELERARTLSDVGQPKDLGSYAGSDATCILEGYAVAARWQRSPREYDRGYFPQEHYILMPRAMFAALGNNFAYVLGLLPDEIPWRSHDETLATLAAPTRARANELSRADAVLARFGDQLYRVLELALNNQPFCIVPTENAADTLDFLQTVNLMLPPAMRLDFTWALNVQNPKRCHARLQVLGARATGTENLNQVRLGAPLSSSADPAPKENYYVALLKKYVAHVEFAQALHMVEALTLPETQSWQEKLTLLNQRLYQAVGPALLNQTLAAAKPPYESTLLDQLVPMLDQEGFNLSRDQRALFLVATVDGVLNQKLAPTEVLRVPREIGRVNEQILWQQLEPLFVTFGTTRDAGRWSVLQQWKKDASFWQRATLQQWLHRILQRDLASRKGQPEAALKFMRYLAGQQLLPIAIEAQAELLTQALLAAPPPPFLAEPLIESWAELSNHPESALRLTQLVPRLGSAFAQDPKFAFVLPVLRKASPAQVEQQLAARTDTDLDGMAEVLLSLALMGERCQLDGLRSPRIFKTLFRYSERENVSPRAASRAQQARELLAQNAVLLDPAMRYALAEQLARAGQFTCYAPLLGENPQLLEPLVSWLLTAPLDTPNYVPTLQLAIEWLKRRPREIQDSASRMAQELFERWLRTPARWSPQVIELTYIIFRDALRGEFTSKQKFVVNLPLFSDSPISRAVAGIQYLHDRSVKNGVLPEPYIRQLERAYRDTTQNSASQMDKLIHELRNARLEREANLLDQLTRNPYATVAPVNQSSSFRAGGASAVSSATPATHAAPPAAATHTPTSELIQRLTQLAQQTRMEQQQLLELMRQLDRVNKPLAQANPGEWSTLRQLLLTVYEQSREFREAFDHHRAKFT